MLRRLFTLMAVALLSGGLLFPSLRAEDSNNHTSTTAVHPFTHFAYIPVGADLGTIRFEKVRMVKVPAGFQYTADPNYCQELAFRDPGGSIACPSAQSEAPVPAYEATYSYTGQPLASDEYAGRSFTFSVYFQPGELARDVQRALAGGKLSRSDAAAYFAVNTYREPVRRVAINNQQSHFCEGNFVDGMWAHTNPGCKDSLVYTSVTVPSGYITIKVEPVSKRSERAEIVAEK